MYPNDVKIIIKRLTDFGFEAYIVGGAVRDIFLGKNPGDYDFCTNALPNQIIEIFKNYKVVEIGKKFGTIGVVVNDNFYEITTFRKEDEYDDHRRPLKVEFVNELYEDLSRRDFTINAMAYSDKLYDFFDGLNDLKNGLIRTVGNPQVRFEEDGLRILRCFRFASTLGFEIEKTTEEAAIKYFNYVLYSSWQRRAIELKKMISGKYFYCVIKKYGIYFKKLLSIFEFDEYYKYINEKQDLILRILIMYKEHQDILDEDLCKMELNKKIISKILVIYKCFNYIDFSGEKNIRKKINLIINDTSEVEEILYYAIKLKRVLNFIDDEEYQNFDKNIQSALNNVYLPSHIVVKGDALLEWGYDKANVKGILNEVLYKIIKGDLKNNYTDIKNYVINNF